MNKFEDNMKLLQSIVEKLEDDDTDLDTSIKLYEQGIKLSKDLKQQLNGFEEKINSIGKEDKDE